MINHIIISIISWALLGFAITGGAFQLQQARLPSPPASSRAALDDALLLRRATRTTATKLDYSLTTSTIDITENAPRDVALLFEWAANYGVQTSPGFELSSDDGGLLDVYAITNQHLPADSPIVCVPNSLILTGSKASREFAGPDTAKAERALKLSDHMSFYLFLKVLKEYEMGTDSPWYQWLNSLPRYYSNGASMTDFCFGCLPPYAAKQAQAEMTRLKRFELALDEITFLSRDSKSDSDLTKWAYNVVHTRYQEMTGGDYCLAPMIDFFNHGGEEVDVHISYDDEGNCYAYSARDVQAGQPLRISNGDPTNPSQLLARYGFLDESSSATYCKWIPDEPSSEIFDLGYPSRMLFYQDGNISNEVWDVLLYTELRSPNERQAFYQACMMGDEATKSNYHSQYFVQTLAALQLHVSFVLNELEELGVWQMTKVMDSGRHPRLPLIMRHNEFVKNTFERVRQNLGSMGY
mmetsp:Transcript_30310/g.73193  ORF Transcript_30310/g.73193 Transcript_30310/m.73193 type:complete len:467 (-) Transcript_30310:83-1483(-)